MEHTGLWVSEYVEPRGINYHFLVSTSFSSAHTAFRSDAGLRLWASQRGLVLPPKGADGLFHGKIEGRYKRQYVAPESFYSLQGLPLPLLDNGCYTLGIITKEEGVCVENLLNPNERERAELEYFSCNKFEYIGFNPFNLLPLTAGEIIGEFHKLYKGEYSPAFPNWWGRHLPNKPNSDWAEAVEKTSRLDCWYAL